MTDSKAIAASENRELPCERCDLVTSLTIDIICVILFILRALAAYPDIVGTPGKKGKENRRIPLLLAAPCGWVRVAPSAALNLSFATQSLIGILA